MDTSKLTAKLDLDNLKAAIDKIDVGKLKTPPVDLSKLRNVVNNDVVKALYNSLVTLVNSIDTSRFILKTEYQTQKSDLENKICDSDKKYRHSGKLAKKQTIVLKLVK